MSLLSKLLSFFKIDVTETKLNRERFAMLTKQVPLMYGMLVVDMFSLVYPHWQSAPLWLTVGIPFILTLVFIRRSIGFVKDSKRRLTDIEIAKKLKSTSMMSALLGVIFIVWALKLLQYGDTLMHIHVAFFLYITLISCMFFLMYLLQSAVLLTLAIIVPSFTYFLMQGEVVFNAIAFNSLLASIVIIVLLFSQYRNFKSLVKQKHTLTEQGKQLEQFNKKNIQLANMDTLTSLPNRRSFFNQLDILTKQFATRPDKKLVVGLLDLDGFKRINDIFGHPTGDDLLVKTSERLTDVLGEGITLARLGGDEFGIIITNPDHLANILEIGEKMCEAMRAPFQLRDGNVQIAATVGFVEYPSMASDPQTLFERADYALCYSKQHSKGKPVIFSTKHEAIIREVSSIEHQLHEANLDEELSIMFQPIVDMKSQTTMGFEALARWNNPILGYVRPDIFIRSAEQMGTVSKLTVILLKKALHLAAQWPDDLYMSFNLSVYDLASPETILNLVSIVEKSEFPANRIVFEVTETAVMHDFEKANDALHLLKLQGAKIALDDFGTGYSSLSYVQKMPLDRLKIDRSFINEIHTDKNTRNIVRTIIDLCNNLNLYCIIEGVETEDQLMVVEQIGGRYVQGYYYSRPLNPDDALAFLGIDITGPKIRSLADKWADV